MLICSVYLSSSSCYFLLQPVLTVSSSLYNSTLFLELSPPVTSLDDNQLIAMSKFTKNINLSKTLHLMVMTRHGESTNAYLVIAVSMYFGVSALIL